MISKFALAASITGGSAFAAATDYVFEAVTAEVKKGDDVTVTVRLIHKPSGKPVADAVIIRTRVDMAPDGMADMQSPVSPLPARAGTSPQGHRASMRPQHRCRGMPNDRIGLGCIFGLASMRPQHRCRGMPVIKVTAAEMYRALQ